MGSVASSRRKLLLPHPLAQTEYGSIEGRLILIPFDKHKRSARVFLGIPFARPPVGKLRFEKPVVPEPWKSTLRCHVYRSACVQKYVVPWQRKRGNSEDCLYLNIVVPNWEAPTSAGFPVMLYVHGGGFVMDSANHYHYAKIARRLTRHGVIVVTIQYRLGLLGFLCTNDDTVPGNNGLWDQLAALRFVKKNIAQFGGDPHNLTLFGQSAGGVSVDLLSICPVSREYVDKVVVMGGNGECIWAVTARSLGARNCQQLAEKLGYRRKFGKSGSRWCKQENQEMLSFLRQLPANKFEMSMMHSDSVYTKMRLEVTPIVDGDFIPAPPVQLRQQAPQIPRIAGVTRNEGLIFVAIARKVFKQTLLRDVSTRLSDLLNLVQGFSSLEQTRAAQEELQRHYGLNDLTASKKAAYQRAIVNMLNDAVNNCALLNYVNGERSRGSPVWTFVFDHHNTAILAGIKMFLPFNEATHATELCYLFGVNIYETPFKMTKTDENVSLTFTTLVTNFAKHGDPNIGAQDDPSPLAQRWERADEDYPERHLVLAAHPKLLNEFESRRIAKYADVYALVRNHNLNETVWETETS